MHSHWRLASLLVAALTTGCRTAQTTSSAAQSAPATDAFAADVTPQQSGGLWQLTFGQVVLAVDAARGASIPTFSRHGSNVLAASSWLRPSPQNAWGWPPPPAVETLPYTASVSGNVLTMRGQVDNQWGLQATKRFWANAEHGVATIEYTLTNTSNHVASWAPWEISRVHPTGLTFFPAGVPITAKASAQQLPLQTAAGLQWLDLTPPAPGLPAGHYITAKDGKEGWIAHCEAGLLLIKTYPDISPAQMAPDEGEIQLYTEEPASSSTFLEVEEESAYTQLNPGQSVVWTVHWYLLDLPSTLTPNVGSVDLVNFVRGQILH